MESTHCTKRVAVDSETIRNYIITNMSQHMHTMGEFMFRLEKRLTLQLTLFLRINTEIIVNMN